MNLTYVKGDPVDLVLVIVMAIPFVLNTFTNDSALTGGGESVQFGFNTTAGSRLFLLFGGEFTNSASPSCIDN